MEKVCKFYVSGKCKEGAQCKFKHEENICKDYFFGDCKTVDCKYKHTSKLKAKNIKKKNTETFEPVYKPADIQVYIADSSKAEYQNKYSSRDVIIAPNLFCDVNDKTIYENLLKELESNKNTDLWKLWHGDTHLIADDHINWKKNAPTFKMIIDKIAKYFRMDVKATRLNWFRDSNDFKPMHHDAAAIDPEKAKKQNLTIGVSFGATREIAFEKADNRTLVSIPLPNGTTYGFASQVNVEWRHGVLAIEPDKAHNEGRISVIAWGWVGMEN
jgi:hypothetical protein